MAAIEQALAETQDALAIEAKMRDASLFETLVEGSAGVGGVYGLWRRIKG
jgi:hypothetical protein